MSHRWRVEPVFEHACRRACPGVEAVPLGGIDAHLRIRQSPRHIASRKRSSRPPGPVAVGQPPGDVLTGRGPAPGAPREPGDGAGPPARASGGWSPVVRMLDHPLETARGDGVVDLAAGPHLVEVGQRQKGGEAGGLQRRAAVDADQLLAGGEVVDRQAVRSPRAPVCAGRARAPRAGPRARRSLGGLLWRSASRGHRARRRGRPPPRPGSGPGRRRPGRGPGGASNGSRTPAARRRRRLRGGRPPPSRPRSARP